MVYHRIVASIFWRLSFALSVSATICAAQNAAQSQSNTPLETKIRELLSQLHRRSTTLRPALPRIVSAPVKIISKSCGRNSRIAGLPRSGTFTDQ
jgi:hypothetical protein